MATGIAVVEEVQDTEENELDSALEASGVGSDVKDEKVEDTPVVVEETADSGTVVEGEKGDEVDPIAARLATQSEEIKELKQMLRVQQRASKISEQKLTRFGKRPAKVADGFEETEDEADGKEKVSNIESLQDELNSIANARGDIFELMLDNMELKTATADVRSICTESNFADIFEVIAQHQTVQSGGDFDENLLKVETSIWKMKNPYKYMYDVIKKYHPTYAEAPARSAEDPAAILAKTKADGKVKAEVKAPGSIANLGGGDANLKSGWTAEKITNLPEDRLHEVPDAVYEKYMLGELK